jgi:hypothetical protein
VKRASLDDALFFISSNRQCEEKEIGRLLGEKYIQNDGILKNGPF